MVYSKKILSVILLVSCIAVLAGCAGGNGGSKYTYEDENSYRTGGTAITDLIRTIEIDWYGGSVSVAYHDGDTVEFSETSENELTEAMTLRYKVTDEALVIKYAKSGTRLSSDHKKSLTVYIPKGTALRDVEIETVSADISVDHLTAAQTEIKTVSGSIDMKYMSILGTADITSVSGTINASFASALTGLYIETVSGSASAVVNKTEEFDIETISGEVTVDFASLPQRGGMESVSGDITLYLPEEVGFTLVFDTTSGKASIEHKFFVADDGSYVYGNGEYKYGAGTVSGDIFIKKHANAEN